MGVKHVQLPDGSIGEFPDTMQDSEIEAVLQKQYGAPSGGIGTLGDTIKNIGVHAMGALKAPMSLTASSVDPNAPLPSRIGHAILDGTGLTAASRLIGGPSIVQSAQDAVSAAKQGNWTGRHGAIENAADAVPMVGPWAKNVQAEADTQGIVPALAGLATDVLAPAALAKGVGMGLQASGRGVQLAAATPETRAIATTRALVPGTPTELLTRALKPISSNTDFEGAVANTLPSIANEIKSPGVAGFRDAAQAVADNSNDRWQTWMAPFKNPAGEGPFNSVTASGKPIADASMQNIPVRAQIEDRSVPAMQTIKPPVGLGPDAVPSSFVQGAQTPYTAPEGITYSGGKQGIVSRTADRAQAYNRNFNVPTLDALRTGTNAELDSFYAKAGGDKNVALQDADTRRLFNINNATRDLQYQTMADNGSPSVPELQANQQQYGDAANIANVASKRAIVYGRQAPLSIGETFAAAPGDPVRSAVDFTAQRMLKNATGSDALVNAAVSRSLYPSAQPLLPTASVPSRAGVFLGQNIASAGQALRAIPANRLALLNGGTLGLFGKQ